MCNAGLVYYMFLAFLFILCQTNVISKQNVVKLMLSQSKPYSPLLSGIKKIIRNQYSARNKTNNRHSKIIQTAVTQIPVKYATV